MALLTGKTVDLDHVSLLRGLVDAWGPSGTVGLFHFSFVWPVNYINYISTIYSATWGVIFSFMTHIATHPTPRIVEPNININYIAETLLRLTRKDTEWSGVKHTFHQILGATIESISVRVGDQENRYYKKKYLD